MNKIQKNGWLWLAAVYGKIYPLFRPVSRLLARLTCYRGKNIAFAAEGGDAFSRCNECPRPPKFGPWPATSLSRPWKKYLRTESFLQSKKFSFPNVVSSLPLTSVIRLPEHEIGSRKRKDAGKSITSLISTAALQVAASALICVGDLGWAGDRKQISSEREAEKKGLLASVSFEVELVYAFPHVNFFLFFIFPSSSFSLMFYSCIEIFFPEEP